MDTLIRIVNGKEDVWYSEEYIKKQIENAFRSGIANGIRVQFHALTPMDGSQVDDLTSVFWKNVHETYQKCFEEGKVIRGGHKRKEFETQERKDERFFLKKEW